MWDYVVGGVTLWAAVFGLIMFYNGRITRNVLGEILRRMEKNQEAMLKNQEAMLKNQEATLKNQEAMLKNQEAMLKNQEAMFKNQEAMFKNQERAVRDHEVLISALQEALKRAKG